MTVEWEARLRKEFQEDPAMFLQRRYGWIIEKIEEHGEKRKSFMQDAAESRKRSLAATRDSLIFCVAVVAIIALASAGLWIGVGGVAVFLVVERWWSFYVERLGYRLDRFRRRFRELLNEAAGPLASDMLAEDKEFLRKYEDSILFPLAVAEDRRERVSTDDLEHIETLYREYHGGIRHHHAPPLPNDPNSKDEAVQCTLCMAARRVRGHIEGVLSKFEAAMESARQTLVTRIDGSTPEGAILTREFLEDFCKWWVPTNTGTEMRTLLDWLRDRDRWTFDQADKVLETCRADESVQRVLSIKSTEPHDESGEPAWKVYDKLLCEMKGAAVRCGLEETWKFYDSARDWFLGGGKGFHIGMRYALKVIRHTLGRRNPEAMFRELCYQDGSLRLEFSELESLKAYGFDRAIVERELRSAKKIMARERGEWDWTFEKELAAAKGFALAESAVSGRRYEEHGRALNPPPALRVYRAVGRLIRKLFGIERFLSEAHSTFEVWLLEVCTVSLFIGGVGLAAIGEIVERGRGIHFPIGVAVIPVVMISASLFFAALTEAGWRAKLQGIWNSAIWTVGLLFFFYWFRMR